jgi:hypothetical protein
VTVTELWEKNKHRNWIRFLHDEILSGSKGKDFDTIRWWMTKFQNGETSTVDVNYANIVMDGNHRLVAAKLVGVNSLVVRRSNV